MLDNVPQVPTQSREKFATYYRDETTALDYARNRYYSSTIARFTAADPYGPSARPGAPQTWNRYSYVGGDPVNYRDRNGLFPCWVGAGEGRELTDREVVSWDAPYLQAIPDIPHAGETNPNQGWLDAKARANAIAQLIRDKRDWSSDCRSTLETMGVSPIDGPGDITMDPLSRLQAAAAAVVFQNGALSDTPLTELYAGSHDPRVASAAPGGTVGEYFADNPSTTAMAQLGGNQVWVNAGLFSVFGEGWLAGTIMHELVHNITGLTDVDFQRALGIDEGASRNISIRLATDCFGWSAP